MSTTTVNISAAQVKELREKTGAPMMDCKQALTEARGDFEQAVVVLRKKGVSVAAKKATRVTSEGSVASYIHAGGKIGVLVEVNCESDFVAKTPEFQSLVKEIAMQIAAANPRSVRREELPAELIEQERQIYASQAVGKPEALINKIVDGKLEKFFAEFCLYEQAWVRDPNRRIKDLIGEFSGKLGEKLEVRRFVRFQLGENIDAKGPASAAE
jgi:elongation factor Ts